MYRQEETVKRTIYKIAAGLAVLFLAIWIGSPILCRAAAIRSVEEARSGVVRIFTLDGDGGAWTGSGFGVGTAGQPTDIYVTNRHVVTDENGNLMRKVYILLSNDAVSGNKYDTEQMIECEVIYTTGGYPDVAILRAERPVEGHIALPLMHAEDASYCEPVYALGFPASADVVNAGYLYAEAAQLEMADSKISKFFEMEAAGSTMAIQHHAHINHGSSGGPLITEDYCVIGINTYFYGEQMMEYSVSIYVDYAMVGLDSLGIAYDVYTPEKTDGSGGIQRGFLAAAVIVFALALVLTAVALAVRKRLKARGELSKADTDSGAPGNVAGGPRAQDSRELSGASAASGGEALRHVSGGGALRQAAGGKTADSGIRLQGTGGYFSGRRFAVNGRIRIGRDPSRNDLVYPQGSQGISGVHCEICLRDGEIYLCDMGSTYGTFLGGRKLPARQMFRLRIGDIFSLGSSRESFTILDKKDM